MRIIYKVATGLLIFFSPFISFGQEALIAEPEYTGNVLIVIDGKGQALEKQKASSKAKAGASMYIVGLGKIKGSNVVTGMRSPIRILQHDNIELIVRVADNSVDPFQLINIFKLEQNSNKNNRSIEVSSVASFSGAKSNDIEFIPFEAKKYGEKSYLVKLQKQLMPGEYAVTIEGSRNLFNMFGVE